MRNFYTRISFFFWNALFKLLASIFFKTTVKGRENLPRSGNYIFAANHQNFVDGFFISTLYPSHKYMKFIIAGRALKTPFQKFFGSSVGAAITKSLHDTQTAYLELTNQLNKGGFVGIFPEGDISSKSIPRKFKHGVAKLSIDTKSKVVPIYINGTYELRKKDYLFSRPEIVIRVGKPIELYKFAPECYNNLEKLSEYLRDEIIQLSGLKELIDVEKKMIFSLNTGCKA